MRQVSHHLATVLAERGLSLRGAAAASGVNRQAIADLLAGRSWPDVATVARLGGALSADLWPPSPR
ncbi:helix-turn-helix domain-containing protein [Streptacidiphilus sp. EB129]|uniref:helix-turn-helix domain-containing protein n=1 Tax=Streptacidiphilus sp. EB129 TaxID=3156262 RepID=UPI0035121276